MYRRLSYLCSILLILGLACNTLTAGPAILGSPTPPLSPSVVNVLAVTVAPTHPPVATPEPVPPLTGLVANLNARVDSGEWTREQGLVTSMKFLAGEARVQDINPNGRKITAYEGSGIVRAVNNYLDGGPDAATQAELQRLLDLILPDPAKLELYSVPTAGNTSAAHLAKLKTQTDCASLWRAGFPEGSATPCFEYRSITVGGQEYRLYIPSDWPATDPRRAWAEPTMEAVRDAVETYLTYGRMPPATLVFTLLPDPDFPDFTHAQADVFPPDTTCRIALLPLIASNAVADFQQLVAHELFHCFQFENFPAQEGPYAAGWWVEGTAEYFSNVVYPDVNREHIFAGDFDYNSVSSSLVEMDYENFLFFQYLANQTGDEGVLALMNMMPTEDGKGPQLTQLSSYPGIDGLFHEFAKTYLDRSIPDSGGGVVPVSPQPGDVSEFGEGEQSKPFSSLPFVIVRYQLRFQEDTQFTLSAEETDGTGKYAVRPTAFVGGWRALPPTLNTACDENEYWLLLTSVSTSGENSYEVTVNSTGERLEGEDPQCDRCLLGTWQLTNDSLYASTVNLQNQGGGLAPGYSVELVSVAGSLTLTFFSNQSATGEQIDLSLVSRGTGPGGETLETQALYNGTAEATYQTREIDRQKVIAFSNTKYDLVFSQTLNIGGVFQSSPPPISMTDTNFSFFLSATELYDCSEDILLFTSNPTLGTLQFVRAEP